MAVTAYLLEQNGYPAGAQSRLASEDQRKTVRLTAAGRVAPAPDFIPGPGGMRPSTIAPDQAALEAAATDASSWPYHTQNYRGTRASPATQITPANARGLQVACAFQMGESSNFQTGPLVYDGVPLWRFNIVPGKDDPGSETWKADAKIPLGGGAVWTPIALDTARGQMFVATTNPAPDFPSEQRGDKNLYTNTLLVLDVRTGKVLWYDQLVPEDDHDWDLTQASPLITVQIDGRPRDLVVTVGKDGMLRALDRVSHERVYETPVTTRSNVDAPVTAAGTHACPGVLGGVEWNGPAFNAKTNLLYVPAVDWCGTFKTAENVRFIPGAIYLGGTYRSDTTSQGWLTAIDASSGEVKWKYRSPRPLVAAATTSAGGVVMTGELTGDFLVLDADSGKETYRFNTGGPIGGGIVTYQIAGRQYVAVASGSPSSFWVDQNPGSPTVFVFALPAGNP